MDKCVGATESVAELGLLRDQLDAMSAGTQNEFVALFLPCALKQLEIIRINGDVTSKEHMARLAILTVLRALPAFVEAVRPHVDAIMPVILTVMREDVDDIAAEAMQLFTEMNKAFRSAVEQYVAPFLDFILEVARNFANISHSRLAAAAKGDGKTLPMARMAFRLLNDAPVMIVLVFQLHRRFINEYIPRFVPVVMELLEVDIEQPHDLQPEIHSVNDLGNTESITPARAAYVDYISAQIKVLSFLAYIARGFAPSLREHKEAIPKVVVRLLGRCPPEGAPARKELLVAVRHVLSTELRTAFLPHLEALMDERLLLGEGYTAYYVFRPAAYSMLADLIHHVRMDLPPPMVGRVIGMYSRALHDPTLPNGIQTMSIKLLLNLVDTIAGDRFPLELRRNFLLRILTTVLQKFYWMNKLVAEMLVRRKAATEERPFDEKRFDPFFDDPLHARPVPTDQILVDHSRDNIRDLKFQLKTLIHGIKNLTLALRATPLPDGTGHGTTGGFTTEEGEMFLVKLFRDGIMCFDIFHFKFPADQPSAEVGESLSGGGGQVVAHTPSTIPADEKDLMDQFGYIFTLLEPTIFHDVIASNMDFLIERTKENIALVSIPQYFLAISGISRGFAGVLARHLMDRFEEIGSGDAIAGAVVLRLFKLLFLAVSVYPEENESVLQPYLADIIMNCFRHYPKAVTPANYFLLLRSLFRSIGGGRFDSLYKEVLPLLQTILDELTHLSPSAADLSMRDMYVELCLTTPVRLSNLLPFLSYLMKPVLIALQSGVDLINQGLRTFELCIDNLTPDFLEPILAPVFTDVLGALWRMLKPPPANQLHSHTAVRLLGKLGGKSRRFLTTPPSYAHRKSVGTGLVLEFRFDIPPMRTIRVPCDAIARVAMITLNSPSRDLSARQQALAFLKRSVAGILGNFGISEALDSLVGRLAQLQAMPSANVAQMSKSEEELLSEGRAMARGLDIHRLVESNAEQSHGEVMTDEVSKQLLCEITCALFDAYVQTDLREEVSDLLVRLYRLFVTLFMLRIDQQQNNEPLARILACLDFDVLSDIMMEYTTVQNEAQAALAWEVVRVVYDQYCICIPDREVQFEHKVFFLVADKSISACFRTNTYQRVAACRTISRLCDLDLSLRYYWHHEIRLIRGVLYVMKSLPAGASAKYSEELTGVVFKVLRLANHRLDSKEESQMQTDGFLAQRRQYFDQVMLALVTELSNPNGVVRDAVKASFQLLSDIQGCEVTDLLTPLKSRVYGPIFSKPLRALPLNVQVGYIDAITYCLSLRPPLLELDDQLLRLVNEAVTVIESEDSALVSRANLPSNASNLLNLRLVCIKLLSTCLSGGAEFQQPRLHPLRNQIVSVFFKTLYGRPTELVDVARTALEQVMAQQHKLPTELLQNGLRPVLQNLGEPRHLNLAAVEGLRRILQLFSHFFKAEIGKKLLDHLNAWAEQQTTDMSGNTTTSNASGRLAPPSSESSEVKVITAIMELFCLLPSCGQMFMGDLFQVILQLETVLRRRSSSPFRPVLLKFMELYPQDAVSYLVEHIEETPIVSLFAAIISGNPSSACKTITELSKAVGALASAYFREGAILEMRLRHLSLIRHYYEKCAGSIAEGSLEQHVQLVRALWDSLPTDGQSPLEILLARMVCDVTMIFVGAHPGQIECAFLILRVFVQPQVVDMTELPAFFRSWLNRCDEAQLRMIVNHWLDMNSRAENHFFLKERAMRLIIQPLVAGPKARFIDDELAMVIEKIVWRRDCRSCRGGSCVIAIEEIQITVLLIHMMRKHRPDRLSGQIRNISAFLLNRVQSLDHSVKYAAFYTLALTMVEIKANPQECLAIFSAVLRAPTQDVRVLLKQTVDLLLPYLARCDEPAARDKLLEQLGKTMVRESSNTTLVMTLWQSISGMQNDMLGSLRDALLRPLVLSFYRCGLLGFATAENRQATLDIAQTILNWHQEAGKKSPLFSEHLIELVLNGLIRLLCSLPDYSDTAPFDRGLSILDAYMSSREIYGANYTLRLGGLERLFVSADLHEEPQIAMATSGMRLLSLVIARRGPGIISSDLAQYEKWLRALMERASGKTVAPLGGLLAVVFGKLAGDDSSKAEDLKETLTAALVEGLNSGRQISVCIAALSADSENVMNAEHVLPAFSKAFMRVAREHIGRQDTNVAIEAQTVQQLVSQVLIPGIRYGVAHIGHPDMPRGVFLSALQTLWEHNTNADLMACLLEVILKWVRSTDPVPSVREKVELLLVPRKTESLNDVRLMDAFLDIIYEVYSRPIFARTELRSRLEGAFLHGLRAENTAKRNLFIELLDANIPRNIGARLRHVFETQRWELAGSYYWIPVAMELILRSAAESRTCIAHLQSLKINSQDIQAAPILEQVAPIMNMLHDIVSRPTLEHVSNIGFLATLDDGLCHGLWISLFPALWSELGPESHVYLNGRIVRILANDAYLCQARMRPSIIKSIVEALLNCRPLPSIPPFLIAYAMRTYSSWYSGCSYLERIFEQLPVDLNVADVATKEQPWLELISVMGAMYRDLGETDFMFGAYRRGFLLNETNVALSFDQMDLWGPAQKLLEGAMGKCRAGTVPFCEAEFSVWEERWVAAAKELQQWDLLTDISRADMDADLGMECLWRLADWGVTDTHVAAANLLKSAGLEPTSRLKFFESFLTIVQNRDQPERFNAFQTCIEEALQLALHEWQSLPVQPCPAHAQILHTFQMLVEIQESLTLYSNLTSGATGVGMANLSRPQFLADLKGMLTAWRERLPNPWDRMDYWSDILAWRQHVFSAINAAFAPLVADPSSAQSQQQLGTTGAGGTTAAPLTGAQNSTGPPTVTGGVTHPFAFRGYHEMAWLINRFAHVARKNHLSEVCLSFLNRIYTLPNIEIQDAFLKLREQAKCYMENPTDLPTALEVVNATNLNYFSGLQKGEFFALRGLILSRLGMTDEANRVFAQAVQIDLNMGHGWAAWGRFNDQRFSQAQDINLAVNAINCYLQAATLFKAHQSRRFLARILWLLTFEDAAGSLGKSFEMYNHDLPTWFWVSFVPQLLASLARKEQRQARFVLIKIARNYPQALYLPLRTFHDDCRMQFGPRANSGNHGVNTSTANVTNPPVTPAPSVGFVQDNGIRPSSQQQQSPHMTGQSPYPGEALPGGAAASEATAAQPRKHPMEAAEDLLSILKTGYPLLALTMENAIEHICHRLRSTVDEDFYRVLTSLIGESYQHIMNRISGIVSNTPTTALMEASLRRVYTMICNSVSLAPSVGRKPSFSLIFLVQSRL